MLLAQGCEHAETVHPGQHDVEHHELVVPFGGEVAAFDAVASNVDRVASFAQTTFDVVGLLGFVFDDQDAHDVEWVNGWRAIRLRAMKLSRKVSAQWVTNT